jgi:hemoglobin
MNIKHDIIIKDDIKTLIDAFYGTVRNDDVIGYIFNEIAQVDWPHHLPRMYAFWEFLLLQGDGYQGNPMEAHNRLAQKIQLKVEHFDRWVALFKASVDAHFEGPVAESAKLRAEMIAETWKPKFTQKT